MDHEVSMIEQSAPLLVFTGVAGDEDVYAVVLSIFAVCPGILREH